jgi:signal transduction histidine kinase
LGVLCVGHREQGRFGADETRLLTLLANAGAIAMENARLYKQAEQAAALAERERIVAEIHDGLAQTLGFLDVRLATVRGLIASKALAELPDHLALMQQTIGQANWEARRLMAGLQTRPQGERTLDEDLEHAVQQFAGERGIEVAFRAEAGQSIRESPEVRLQVVRILLEALTNVHKHACTGRATVTLGRSAGQAVLSVRDEGPGFDIDARSGEGMDEGHHFGLKVMETRARRIGGELRVESAPGRGTTVTLRWPAAGG